MYVRPPIGAYVTLGENWRWTQWTMLFFVIAVLIPSVAMKETYKAKILQRRARRGGKESVEPLKSRRQALSDFTTKILVRPPHMIFTEPVVGLFTLYIALNFGMVYAFFAAFPYVFAEAYGFGIGSTV